LVSFFLGTVGLSLAILIPMAIWWNSMVFNLEKDGLIVPPTAQHQLWQGFAILALVVIVSVATLMGLLIFWDGEKNVVR